MNTIQRHNEFDDSSTTFSEPLAKQEKALTETSEPKIYRFPVEDRPESRGGYKSIDDVVSDFEKSEKGRAALAHGRSWVAKTFYGADDVTLRTLRLKNNLSQQSLAELTGTVQSHIARIEQGSQNPLISTCRRICSALNVDMNTLDGALQRQEELFETKSKR